jgi:uncharacterized membrane protein
MDTILLLGVVTGMRSMTAMAALCWAAWLGLIPEHGWGLWIAHLAAAILFTLCALGEYVADTLPKTPRRTDWAPALFRVLIASLIGALVANAIDEPLAGGILFGALGAVIGTWGGFFARMSVARLFGRDLPAALLESASAILIAVLVIAKLHHGILIELHNSAHQP